MCVFCGIPDPSHEGMIAQAALLAAPALLARARLRWQPGPLGTVSSSLDGAPPAGAAPRRRHDLPDLSPRRAALDRAVLGLLEAAARHWLLLINLISFAAVALPVLAAPWLLAHGAFGPARTIFDLYKLICHQMPERSFFIFGEQMAFCQRDAAIFGAFFLAGVGYIPLRRRLRSLPTWLAVAYCAPLAVDGVTQLFGWRESTWELRIATGALFGLTAVWYVFPHLELLMRLVATDLHHDRAAITPAS